MFSQKLGNEQNLRISHSSKPFKSPFLAVFLHLLLAFELLLLRRVLGRGSRTTQGPKGSAVKHENQRLDLGALTSQLEFLKSRIRDADAAHWRKMGKLAQDFTVWLERARPWISCASSLIALRVEQVIGEIDPQRPSETSLKKLSDLLEEASRQLAQPGRPIQVLDMEKEGRASNKPDSCFVPEGVSLPVNLVEIPEILRPRGQPAVQFLYIIPN